MPEKILITLSLVILLGIGAEWIGWRFQFPALILFLMFGFLAGPVTGLINTDQLLGDLLSPFVSLSVAIILFEGGLNLKVRELKSVGKAVRNLISIGVLVSWVIISLAAYLILNLSIEISSLLGAILVVTGPTAIGPLLKHMQLVGRIGSIVRWEGIMIAPSGALLAVLVFEAVVLSGELHETTSQVLKGLLTTVCVGIFIGTYGAFFISTLLRRRWIPDFLQNAVSLAMVFSVYTGSDLIQDRAGLLAVTIMGIVLANQSFVSIKPIVKFKEDLRVLLIPSLFILLAARLQLSDLSYINIKSFLFVAVVFLIARPISVLASVIGLGLTWKEIFFLSWLGPRGIVAASVSSVFALYLSGQGLEQTEYIVPITFLVIITTVTIVGLTAAPLAKYLGLSNPNPQGVLILGGHDWAQSIAKILLEEEFKVTVIDTNRENISKAKLSGLNAYNGNILSETIEEELDLTGIGKLIALTPNDEVNSLAALHFSEILGKKSVYQLTAESEDKKGSAKKEVSKELQGNKLFSDECTFKYINRRLYFGSGIKKTKLSKDFDYENFKEHYKNTAIPLMLITENKNLLIFTPESELEPKPGQILISLVDVGQED